MGHKGRIYIRAYFVLDKDVLLVFTQNYFLQNYFLFFSLSLYIFHEDNNPSLYCNVLCYIHVIIFISCNNNIILPQFIILHNRKGNLYIEACNCLHLCSCFYALYCIWIYTKLYLFWTEFCFNTNSSPCGFKLRL